MNSKAIKRGDVIELTIDAIAFGGQGVGRCTLDDRRFTVFVDDTVPGDRIRARIGGRKRNYAFGFVDEFLARAPNRIAPRCPHFGLEGARCGGCSLQYLSYDDQLKIKEQHVRDVMERIGKLDPSVVRPIVGAPDPWFYRNKMEFSFSRAAKRDDGASPTNDGELALGLHVRRRHHDVVELEECSLFAPYIGELVKTVRNFFRGVDLSREPALKSLVVREGKNTGEILLNLIAENGKASFLDDFLRLLREFFGDRKGLTSVYYTHIVNVQGQPKRSEEHLLWGRPSIREKLRIGRGESLHELVFEISPQAFFQPNTRQAEQLFSLAFEAAGLRGDEVVYDLYCGAGTIALSCAPYARHVYGIELNEAALLNARANAAVNNIKNVTFTVGDVAKELPLLPEKPDVVMVDPPRGGLHEAVISHICSMKPGRIVYVSCNPSTLARDLSLFTKTGCTLESVQPVDMFPQTYHIENVALLR